MSVDSPTPNEEYVWWDKADGLHVAHVVGERDHLIHHRFPDPGGAGHHLSHECLCGPQLIEAGERQEVWQHRRVERVSADPDGGQR